MVYKIYFMEDNTFVLKNNFFNNKVVLSSILLILLSLTFFALTSSGNITSAMEVRSPGNWIDEEQIRVYQSQIILDIPNATWASFTDTNSMDPFIDAGSNAIEIMPDSADEIEVGDVISYDSPVGIIIHRVIEKNSDKDGIYYFVKGDNNPLRDPIKVRFSDIRGVVVAVIY